MRTVRALFILPVLVPFALAYACGGGGKPPTPPENPVASASAAASGMGSAAASAASSAAAVEPPKPAEAAYVIPLANAKFTPDKAAKNWKATEIKEDGSVLRMGKPYMKFVKNELQDDTGKALFAVAKDGSVTMGGKPYAKFDDKDALVVTDGGTISVGDDGAVKLLQNDGKPDKQPVGKFDKVDAKGRRAAVLFITTELWMAAAAAPKKEPPKK